MGIALVGFWIMILWGLYDGDLYPAQAAWCVGIWVVCLVVSLLFAATPIPFIIATTLLDAYLILKLFGGDVKIR